MCQLSPVAFHGDTIFCVEWNGQPYTPMKPIVENMGLAWQSQAAKLTGNKDRWGITMIVIPSEGGEQETLCMPVRKLPAYLASINPKKVKPELRAKIELYQAESDDVLWDYWMNGRSGRPAIAEKQEHKARTICFSLNAAWEDRPLKDRYLAFLMEVDHWRCANKARFNDLLEKGAKLVEVNCIGPVLHEAYVQLLKSWLETMALSDRTAQPRMFVGDPSPAKLAAQLNLIFSGKQL